jgi:hypothetical protein
MEFALRMQRLEPVFPFLLNPHAARVAVTRVPALALAVVSLAMSMQIQTILQGARGSFAVTMPLAPAVRRKPERRRGPRS